MLTRRAVLAAAAAAGTLGAASRRGSLRRHIQHPLAITMWDFSWLERRWPGAGYEDWDLALDELKTRGYDAIRLDAYPHLVAAGADRTWELLPCWNTQDWGSPSRCRVRVQPELNEFIKKCAERGLKIALSTWFRQDLDDTRMRIDSAEKLGAIWLKTLQSIDSAGLLKHILYVDLCNEWPLSVWAPFLPKGYSRISPDGQRWMREPIAMLRRAYPDLDYTFSFTSGYNTAEKEDVSCLDFLELHLWMTHFSDFYKIVGYNYERFDDKGYDNLALKGLATYRDRADHWNSRLKHGVSFLADWSRRSGKPLITTECWAIVDYKDGPLLDWSWIRELCELGTREAAATGRWVAIATSNFCGPQFRGMWRDVEWHRRLTSSIHESRIDPALEW